MGIFNFWIKEKIDILGVEFPLFNEGKKHGVNPKEPLNIIEKIISTNTNQKK